MRQKNTSGAGFTACAAFRHFVQWQNYTTAARSVAFWLVQIDNSSDAVFTFMH